MVMPFVGIVSSPSSEFKIEIWSKSPGLLNEDETKFVFADQTLPISLYHL